MHSAANAHENIHTPHQLLNMITPIKRTLISQSHLCITKIALNHSSFAVKYSTAIMSCTVPEGWNRSYGLKLGVFLSPFA